MTLAACQYSSALFVWWSFFRQVSVEEPPPMEEVEEQGTRSVTLFFGDRNAQGFVAERRSIAASLHRDDEMQAVVEELLRGPNSRRAVRTWPKGTRLRGAFYDEDLHLVYLDFNSALVSNETGGSAMETMTLGALLRTIAVDFPEVTAVQILVDGLEVETLQGHIDCTKPFRPRDWL
jgi:spore germination protein GerM